jgi:hypothetical protein
VVSHHDGRIKTEGVRKQHAEEGKLTGTYRGEFTNVSINLHNEDLQNFNCS